MMPERGLNAGDRTSFTDAVVSRRREEIFGAMVAVADRRRRARRLKQAAAGVLIGAAAVAVTVGVLGTVPPATPAVRSVAGGGTGAPAGGVRPSTPHATAPDRVVTVQVIERVAVPDAGRAAGHGVERVDPSKLARVVVAEALTDEAFAQELATQEDVGTARVRGRVLVLSNRPVAEASRSVH